jgi:hypothetical protein
MDVVYVIHPFTFISAKITKKGSKILLKFDMFNIFSLHNLGSRIF